MNVRKRLSKLPHTFFSVSFCHWSVWHLIVFSRCVPPPRKWSLIEMEVDKRCFLSSFLIQWAALFILRSVGGFLEHVLPSFRVIRFQELWENEDDFNEPTIEALKFNFLKVPFAFLLSRGRVEDEEDSGMVRGWGKTKFLNLRVLPSRDNLFSDALPQKSGRRRH